MMYPVQGDVMAAISSRQWPIVLLCIMFVNSCVDGTRPDRRELLVYKQRSSSDSWTQFLGNMYRNSSVLDDNNESVINPDVLWKKTCVDLGDCNDDYGFNLTASPSVSPIVGGGKLYVVKNLSVVALNLSTGDILWRFDTADTMLQAPIYWNHKMFIIDKDGMLMVVMSDSNPKAYEKWKEGWYFRTEGGYASAIAHPVLVDKLYAYMRWNNGIRILDTATGNVVCDNNLGGVNRDAGGWPRSAGGLASDGKNIYARMGDASLVAFSKDDCHVVWRNEGPFRLMPVVLDQLVIMYNDYENPGGRGNQVVTAIMKDDGKIAWKHKMSNGAGEERLHGMPVANRDFIYTISDTEEAGNTCVRITCLGIDDGGKKWDRQIAINKDEMLLTVPILDKNILYISIYNRIYGFDVNTKRFIWNIELDSRVAQSMAFSEGVLYAVSANGSVYSIANIDNTKPKETSAIPGNTSPSR